MRKLFFLITLTLLLAGCGTSKKVTGTKQEAGSYTEKTEETAKSAASVFVDTTKHSGTKITYTKIEFFPPEPAKEPEAPKQDTVPAEAPPNKHPPNAGAVKSIETLTIDNESEEKGITDSTTSTDERRTTDITSEGTLAETHEEKPVPDPYRWRYIFGILVAIIIIGTAGYFWLRKTGVLTKIVSFVKKIF